MSFSEDRIKTVALRIHDRIYLDNDVDYTDEDAALALIKSVMTKFFATYEKLDDIVTSKILSLKRGVMPGTSEWDIMYSKYMEEEIKKHGSY